MTHTTGEGDRTVTYDLHGDPDTATPDRPALFIFGSPMDASGFVTLTGHFADRPVITYDPRGAGRNPTATGEISVEEHAEDLHRVITAVGCGSVDVLASSGGAVNALALAAAYPGDVRRVVAHEPPCVDGLPDAEAALAASVDYKATYETSGQGAAMAKFIALVTHDGEIPADYVDRPAPDPAMFGMSSEDDGDRTDPLMRNTPACQEFRPDYEALAALGERLIVAVGATSGDALAARGARQVAARLGREATVFPGDHGGFAGGEYGQNGQPDAFAARLRELLDD